MREEIKPEIKQSCLVFAKKPVTGNATWKNKQVFSRDDKERVPTIFEYDGGGFQITIFVGHIFHLNEWTMNCRQLGIFEQSLKATEAEEAAREAIDICREKCWRIYQLLQKV